MSTKHAREGRPCHTDVVRRALREPLLQFFTIGAVLFAAVHAIANNKADMSRHIVIDTRAVDRLAKLYEMQSGTQPSATKLDALVEEYVREEVLYREAVRMGLDQNDEIVRRRLTQKLEFLERDLITVPDPSEAELKRYYAEHAEQFIQRATVTFSHLYFSPDLGGSEFAKRRAEAALAKLRPRSAAGAPRAGDRFPLQHDYADIEKLEVAQLFGQFPIVEALFSSPIGQWVGPVQSGYGWHLILISRRKEATLPPLEEVTERVKQAYLDEKRHEANEQKFEEMEMTYTITRAYRDGSK